MKSQLLAYAVKLSVVGNAILFVLLAGGSHKSPGPHQIYPHKPVHLVRDLGSLNGQPYLTEIHDAQQAWDDVVGGEEDIINNQGDINSGSFDAVVIDEDPGEEVEQFLWDHASHQVTYAFDTPLCDDVHDPVFCWNAVTVSVEASIYTGLEYEMKIVVLNEHLYLFHIVEGNRWRANTHEFGHVLGLGGHESEGPPEEYDGMMDGFPDVYPRDYQIWNLPDIPWVADEASCVRLLFDEPGKRVCSEE
jgi:hypothetical protein